MYSNEHRRLNMKINAIKITPFIWKSDAKLTSRTSGIDQIQNQSQVNNKFVFVKWRIKSNEQCM